VSDYAGTIEVEALTIDTLTEKYGAPNVVYLDVEGMELAALQGAKKTLAAFPDCFVEVHTKKGLEAAGGSVSAVLAHFPDCDYDCFIYTEQSPTPVPLASAGPDLLSERFFLTALSRRPGISK